MLEMYHFLSGYLLQNKHCITAVKYLHTHLGISAWGKTFTPSCKSISWESNFKILRKLQSWNVRALVAYRCFLSQFSINFHEIMQALFASIMATPVNFVEWSDNLKVHHLSFSRISRLKLTIALPDKIGNIWYTKVSFLFLSLEWYYAAWYWDIRHVITVTAVCCYLPFAILSWKRCVSVFLMSLIERLIIDERFTCCAETRHLNVGPASKTVGQHWNRIGWMSCLRWYALQT